MLHAASELPSEENKTLITKIDRVQPNPHSNIRELRKEHHGLGYHRLPQASSEPPADPAWLGLILFISR